MTGSAGSAVDVLSSAIAFFNRRRVREEDRRRLTGSAAKRSGRCVMLELKERGVPGGEGTAIIPDRRPADR